MGDADSGQIDFWVERLMNETRNNPCRVGFEREPGKLVRGAASLHERAGGCEVVSNDGFDFWLRLLLPLFAAEKACFDFAYGGEILVERRAIRTAHLAFQGLHAAGERVHSTPSFAQFLNLARNLIRRGLNKQSVENLRRPRIGRNANTRGRVGKRVVARANAKAEKRKTREMPDLLRGGLIQGNRIPKT